MQTSLALVRLFRKSVSTVQVLLFLHGLFLGLLAWVHIEASYENQLFQSLAQHVKQYNSNSATGSADSIVIRSLHITHQLEKNRSILFGTGKVNSFKSSILKPLTVDLMTAQEACGGFSYVLGRLLQEMDIDIRFAQMKVAGMYGGHILIEAKMPHGWVALDPLYDLYFTRPDGKLASFAEVQADWNHYSAQVPPGYNPAYRYEGVRYTNWNKIPVVMPALKNMLSWNMGKAAAENYSIRNFFLRKFDVIFYTMLAMYGLLVGITARKYYFNRRSRINANPALLFPKPSDTGATPEQVPCSPIVFSSNL